MRKLSKNQKRRNKLKVRNKKNLVPKKPKESKVSDKVSVAKPAGRSNNSQSSKVFDLKSFNV